MITYSGVCIGGPLGGQQLVHRERRYLVETRPPVTLAMRNRRPAATVTQHQYHHTDIAGHGVWLFDNEAPKNAMARLLAIYMAAVQRDNEDD